MYCLQIAYGKMQLEKGGTIMRKINVEIDFTPKNETEWKEFESEEKYKAIITNLYTNAIAFDQLLLGLSGALLGFTINLLMNMNFDRHGEIYTLPYILQIIAFVCGAFTVLFSSMTIYVLIKVFEFNSKYLAIRIKDDYSEEDEKQEKILRKKLDSYDQQAKDYFIAGIFMIGGYVLLILSKNILTGVSNG